MNIKTRLYNANYDYLKGNQNQEISSFLLKKKIFKALRREEIERPIFTTAETNNNFFGGAAGRICKFTAVQLRLHRIVAED